MKYPIILCCLIVIKTGWVFAADPESQNSGGVGPMKQEESRPPADRYRFIDDADSTVIKFKEKDDLVSIKAKVNDEETFRFLLGTGKPATVLSAKVVEKLKLDLYGEVKVRGSVGNVATRFADVDSIRIEEFIWYPGSIEVVENEDESKTIFDGFDGILGYDFLAVFPVRVTFDWSRMVIFDPHTADPPKPGTALEIDLSNRKAIKGMKLDGRPIPVLIDLASTAPFLIFDDWAWANRYLEKKYVDGEKHPFFALDQCWWVHLLIRKYSLTCDELRLGNSVVMFSGHRPEQVQESSLIKAIFGAGALKDYNLFIDYPNSRIYIEERKKNK